MTWLVAAIGGAVSLVTLIVNKIWPTPAPSNDLARVQAGTDAAKAVDPSQKAIDSDPNNLDHP
jgi:hypothetical protein